jgi:putative tricarboxylic transport membrane protein
MSSSFTRRAVLALAAAAAIASPASAQQTELKLMAPAAPGGGWDSTARAMQQALTASGTVRSVQVVNVPGAGGTIGLAQLVNSGKGDGNLLMVNGFVMVGAIQLNKSPVKLSQTTPIARLTSEALVIVVPDASPIKTASDLAERVKTDPAKVVFAGGSAGGPDQILAALFAKAVGADAKRVNYLPFSGGGEALAAMLGGRVTAGISGYGEFESQIKTGKLRVIGVSAKKRLANAPDAPTLEEQGIPIELLNWRSVNAPPGITDAQRATLDATLKAMVESKPWKEALQARGWDDAFLPSTEFAAFLAQETARVEGVMKDVGLVK